MKLMKFRKVLKIKRFDRSYISSCDSCPFKNQNKVWGEGSYGKLVLLGESPGRQEDILKRPFVGDSGKLLDEVLREVGIPRIWNWTGNIICCQPPNNNFNHPQAVVAREKCRKGLEEELKLLVDRGVRIIVPLGKNACSSLGINFNRFSEISSQLLLENCFDLKVKIIPAYHPSYLLRNGGKKSSQWLSWVATFYKIKRELEKL